MSSVLLRFLTLFWLVFCAHHLNAQYIPVKNHGILNLLNELSNEHYIDINYSFLPIGRDQVTDVYKRLYSRQLKQIQNKQLLFYAKEYHDTLTDKKSIKIIGSSFRVKNKNILLNISPLASSSFQSNIKDNISFYRLGIDSWIEIDKVGIWGTYFQAWEQGLVVTPNFLTKKTGESNFQEHQQTTNLYSYYEFGLSYDLNIGHISIEHSSPIWGTNYNGANIFSGKSPPFWNINLRLSPVNWFEFRYIHGWLETNTTDSSSLRRNNKYESLNKYLASNIFIFKPFKWTYISFGNSIIYDYNHPHPAYLIPVMFFKSIDHTLNPGIDNMNSQMFFDFSTRPVKKLHLYSTLFLDELATGRIFDPSHFNPNSFKTGLHLSNIVGDLSVGFEYTRSNSLVFKHRVPMLEFTHVGYNMGHYLLDDSEEIFFNIQYKIKHNLRFLSSFTRIKKGPDHSLTGERWSAQVPSLNPVVLHMKKLCIGVQWEFISGYNLFFEYLMNTITGEEQYLDLWIPDFYSNSRNVIKFGFNYNINRY